MIACVDNLKKPFLHEVSHTHTHTHTHTRTHTAIFTNSAGTTLLAMSKHL
eukprot:TRINITY_DN3168_c0_g1_i1.p2 TRINITY_DN3168_c0_g1~~TRINITY_DN3168_c0_g1_i1.p2  ORF type:complete len:50 (-),score=12.17 TRINITY_DN3168_c0_g1_i1:40-189(-)